MLIRAVLDCCSYNSSFGFTTFIILVFGLGFSNNIFRMNANTKARFEVVAQGSFRFGTDHTKHMEHIRGVLRSLGYKEDNKNWDLYWSNEYPFTAANIYNVVYLQPHQRVNRFAGLGYITSKVSLSITPFRYMPKSFPIPDKIDELIAYSKSKPTARFLQKGKNHRGVSMKIIEQLDLESNKSFVQEYIENPLLIDGHKIDIGVFVIITSANPLRVYMYYGDIPVRFCAEKYYPFNTKVVGKYVIDVEKYLPVWKILSLSTYFNSLGYGSKDSFDYYMRSKGIDPDKIWKEIETALTEIFIEKEMVINKIMNSTVELERRYFELVRFDFIIDKDLKVYMVEANACPNLSSNSKPQNALLFDQVLYNLFSLVGIGQRVKLQYRERRSFADPMISAARNIFVNQDMCEENNCSTRCNAVECVLCRVCLDDDRILSMHEAYREHLSRIECRRLFPPQMTGEDLKQEYLDRFSLRNQVMLHWYNAKCREDRSWCQ